MIYSQTIVVFNRKLKIINKSLELTQFLTLRITSKLDVFNIS